MIILLAAVCGAVELYLVKMRGVFNMKFTVIVHH